MAARSIGSEFAAGPMRFRVFVLVATFCAGNVLCRVGRAEEPAAEVRSRNVVRKKLPRDVKSIALEYSVILVDENGNEKPVDPVNHTFEVGDSFLVRFRPQDDLYVYVFNQGPKGERACLLPQDDEKPKLVEKGGEISLPDDGSYFTFEPPAGEEKMIVVALQQPVDDLRLLARSVFRDGAGGKLNAKPAEGDSEAEPDDIRSRAEAAPKLRGPLRRVVERLDKEPIDVDGRLTHIEPPGEGETSSYGIAIAGPKAGNPELFLDIPLRSSGGKPK